MQLVERVHANSQGATISCTLPPSIGAVAADTEPISHATFLEGITDEVCSLSYQVSCTKMGAAD